ncbi:hypothetical protein HY837_05010 [archaeon]|nr:hypothetical protein [archaeon]
MRKLTSLLLGVGLSGLAGCVSPQTRVVEDPSKYKAAILIAEPSDILGRLAYPFLGIYENAIVDDLRRELNVGTYVIDYSTTKEEFEQVLLDESVQVVVIAGHGTWINWGIGGKSFYESDLRQFAEDHHVKKKKFLVKHTCGNIDFWFRKYDPEKVCEEIHDFIEANKSLRFDHLRDLFNAQDLLKEQIRNRFLEYSSRFKFDDITSVNVSSTRGESQLQEGLRLRQEYEQAQKAFYDRLTVIVIYWKSLMKNLTNMLKNMSLI